MKKLLLLLVVGFVFGIPTNGFSQTRSEGLVVALEVVSIDYVRAILEDIETGNLVKTKKIKKEKVKKGDRAEMEAMSGDSKDVKVRNERVDVGGELLEVR